MAYASMQDLVDRFGSEVTANTDRDADGEADVDVIARALADADGEIDSYIGVRYQLPLVTVPQVLTRVACDIARYRIASSADMATEEAHERYKAAIKWLTDVSKGVAALGVPTTEVGATVGTPRWSSPGRTFTRKSLENF